MSETYLQRVLDGDALWTDIDMYVGTWHKSKPPQELHDYLGFSWEEYALWVEQPQALRVIIAAHERDEKVRDLVSRTDEAAIAARGLSDDDARVIREWLDDTGRLDRDP